MTSDGDNDHLPGIGVEASRFVISVRTGYGVSRHPDVEARRSCDRNVRKSFSLGNLEPRTNPGLPAVSYNTKHQTELKRTPQASRLARDQGKIRLPWDFDRCVSFPFSPFPQDTFIP